MFTFKRTRKLIGKVETYLGAAEDVLESFRRGLDYYFGRGITPHFSALVDEIHEQESRADDLRREIEIDVFKKSLLPEAREDILTLLETIDQIPNTAEEVLRQIRAQHLSLPAFIHADTRELGRVASEMMTTIREGVTEVFGPNRRIREIASQMDKNESVGDQLQHRIIEKVFDSDLETAEKILCRDIVNLIGSLCDLADDVATTLAVMAVKRTV